MARRYKIAIACIILGATLLSWVGVSYLQDISTTGTGTAAATACSAQYNLRLADALVHIADAFDAPPAPNVSRQKAVEDIKKSAHAARAAAQRCAPK